MARYKITTRTVWMRNDEVRILLDIQIEPRGSGNANRARALGKAFREYPEFGKYVTKVIVGTSRVRVYTRPSLGLLQAFIEIANRKKEREQEEASGQLPLFAP